MLQVKVLAARVQLQDGELEQVMESMGDKDRWIPALLESRKVLAKLAGGRSIPRLAETSPTYMRRRARGSTFTTEVFFVKNAVLFVLDSVRPLVDAGVWSARSIPSSMSGNERQRLDGLIVGAVGRMTANELDELIREFCKDLEATAHASIDGRRARHLKFDWGGLPGAPGRIRAITRNLESEDGSEPRFSSVDLVAAEVAAAEVMADPNVRNLMIELSEAGFAREDDILTRRRNKDEFRELLAKMKTDSLLVSEYLLQCRKTSGPLTRVAAREDIQSPGVAGLKCANCNRAFSDELLSEGFSISELGTRLLRGSHWMTVWVTQKLVDLGLPPENILWNVESSGEEVDIIADFIDRLWIFELKDRDFGAGDAHPFNYRKVRYRADEAVVITTEKVSADARRVFAELGKGSGGRRSVDPAFIEGLSAVTTEMSHLFDRASESKAADTLAAPSLASGFDIRRALLDTPPPLVEQAPF